MLSTIETEGLKASFKTIIGYQINNKCYTIFFSNKTGKKYGVLNLDFEKNKANISPLKINLKGEKYLKGITVKDHFYLITNSTSNSNVHFYTFNEHHQVLNKETVRFRFLDKKKNNEWKYASDYFDNPYNSIIHIDTELMNSIEITSAYSKLYVNDNKLVFTFDKDRYKTKIFTISLDDYEKEYFECIHSEKGESKIENSNSYFFNNKLFQLSTTSKALKFKIKDFNSKALVKEINVKKDDSIAFKNSALIQEGGFFGFIKNERELKKTRQFLRKISDGDLGIAIGKQNNDYCITFGSAKEVKTPLIFLNNLVGISGGFDVTFSVYVSYVNTRTTYIECLFNQNFENIAGHITDNVFDRIKIFEDSLIDEENSRANQNDKIGYERFTDDSGYKDFLALKNVFKHGGEFYFGYIDTEKGNYNLHRFKD